MVAILIVDSSGQVIYHSAPKTKKVDPAVDGNRIRFLPLLLTKDLIKNSFHDRIHHLQTSRKTFAFRERGGLFFIAYAKSKHTTTAYLQQRLRLVDFFLRFNFGNEWYETSTASRPRKQNIPLPQTIADRLALLSLASSSDLPYTPNGMGCVEQVELHEDLRSRLTEVLRDQCHAAFANTEHSAKRLSAGSAGSRLTSFFKARHGEDDGPAWSHAFLFARGKLVAKCHNKNEVVCDEEIAPETLFFLQVLTEQYIAEIGDHPFLHDQEKEDNDPERHTLSQTSTADALSEPNTVFGPGPFKVQEKSASSVSPASSASCSTPSLSWNSSQAPTTTIHNQLLARLIRPHETRSTSSRHKLPPNAIAHPASADYPRYLSSSVPLDDPHYRTHRRTSAPSSPRSSNSSSLSRQSSIAESRPASATKQSIRHMFSAFLPYQSHLHEDTRSTRSFEVEMLDPTEGRIEWRWINDKQHHARLARVLLVPIADGLCATVVCKEQDAAHPPEISWATLVKGLGAALEDQLRDFVAFLLTKEETHFSILSFVSAYPGLVHFIHVEHGIAIAPQLGHLPSEHLYDLSDKYDLQSLDHLSWPSVDELTDLCRDMVRHAPDQHPLDFYLHSDTHFQYAYHHSETSDASLLAIYFGFVPKDEIETLHRRLFHDVSQRVLA